MEAPPPDSGGIGAARIRLDGFVSQDAPVTGGWLVAGGILTTVPLKFSGNRLEINMNAGAGGWVKVEILDEAGNPFPQYAEDQADFLFGNAIQRVVTWQGKHELRALTGKVVRLRFIGRDVKHYAFEFTQ